MTRRRNGRVGPRTFTALPSGGSPARARRNAQSQAAGFPWMGENLDLNRQGELVVNKAAGLTEVPEGATLEDLVDSHNRLVRALIAANLGAK